MIPNDFGLIRQKEHNLFACLFTTIDISEYRTEIIYPEYTSEHAYGKSGSFLSSTYADAGVIDISKFDYILYPVGIAEAPSLITRSSGQRNSEISGNFDQQVDMVTTKGSLSYNFTEKISNYLCVTVPLGSNLPVIGFIRHRSDHVNPKGIIKDVNSDILQPVKADELNGEADRIREELPGNAESPDLDSKSGAGADERAGG